MGYSPCEFLLLFLGQLIYVHSSSHHREEITEDSLKLEKEKESLKAERSAFIKERSKNDDKESRIGSLITQLDEKESKLRQMLGKGCNLL